MLNPMRFTTLVKIGGLLSLVVFFSFLTGCSLLSSGKALQQPEVKVKNHSLTGLNLDSAEINLELEVFNPNSFSVNLGSLAYQLNIEEARILSGQQKQANKLAAKKTQIITLPVKVEFKEVSRLVSGLNKLNALNYQLSGNLEVDLLVTKKQIPFQVTGKLPLPKLPKIKFAGLEQQRLSFKGADLSLKLELDNPNVFDVLIKKLNYNLNLNGEPLTTGGLAEVVTLKAEQKNQLSIPVSLEFSLAKAQAFMNLLKKGGSAAYQLDLNSEIGSSLPILQSLPFNSQQAGKLQIK